jgi:lipid II:glycine glycyltransferase (peptidoglycan interpeptide bridge formation enzyme)
MKDLRQTPQYSRYLKDLGWNIETIQGSYVFIRQVPILGSVIKFQRPKKIGKKTLSALEKIGKGYRAFQLSVEPSDVSATPLLLSSGYKLSKSPSLCSKTVHINLKKNENTLLSEMHHKTRYNIKKAKSNNLDFKVSKDIKGFANFWQKCALNQRGMFLSMKEEIKKIHAAFKKDSYILTVRKGKKLLAALLLILSDDAAYYMYAASEKEGKKLYAPTLVTWESIRLAKKLGRKVYDFEGIYDSRFPLPQWKGFSRFKKSFGGSEVISPGSFVKYRIPF